MLLTIPVNGLLELAPGLYDLDGPITWQDRPVTIRGLGGPDLCLLRRKTPGPILQGQYSAYYRGFPTIEGLGLLTTCPNAGTAIEVTYARAESIAQKSLRLVNCIVRPDGWVNLNAWWTTTAQLTGMWYAEIADVRAYGTLAGRPLAGTRGIVLAGRGSVVAHTNVNVDGVEVAFEIMDDTQGVSYDRCNVVRAIWGAQSHPSAMSPQINFTGCHFNTYRRAGILANSPQSHLGANLCYRIEDATSEDEYFAWDIQAGSDFLTADSNKVSNNSQIGGACGMALAGHYAEVAKFIGQNCSPVVWVSGQNNTIRGVKAAGGGKPVVNTGGPTNQLLP